MTPPGLTQAISREQLHKEWKEYTAQLIAAARSVVANGSEHTLALAIANLRRYIP